MGLKWMAVLGCVAVGVAHADRVTLKDGRELVGKVVREGDVVRLVGRFGSVEIPEDEIVSVIEELTPWERWTQAYRGLRPGDLEQTLELVAFARKQRVKHEIPKVLRLGATPALVDPADPFLLEVAELCREHDLSDQWLALLLRGADDQDAVRAVLERMDYHRYEGTWLGPNEYYPKIGYVRWEAGWVPPEQLPVLRAKRRLSNARGRVGGLRSREDDARSSLARARKQIGDYAGSVAQAEVAVQSHLDAVAARERDLDRAQQTLQLAQGERTALAAQPLGCARPGRDADDEARSRYRRLQREREEQLARLAVRVQHARRQLEEATRERDRALSGLERARGRLAHYLACQREAEAKVLSAQDELVGIPEALAAARAEQRQAEQDLAAAERAARAEAN